MFAVARQCRILVLDSQIYQEIKVQSNPELKTRAWIVSKNDQSLDMSTEDFFYSKVMDFQHPELRVLGAKESARSNAFKALSGAKDFRLTGVRHEFFSFKNGIFNWQTGKWYPNGEGLDTSIKVGAFHPADFELYEGNKGDFATGSWYDIPTPAIDTILTHQQFPEEVMRTVYALFIGRLMAPCGQQDTIPWPDWLSPDTDSRSEKGSPLSTHTEVFTMAYGHSGTGKSELTKIPLVMYNDNVNIVGQLQNDSNGGFPIQHLVHARLVISTEMDKKFNLPPTLFNQVRVAHD